jgi:hypothetical protein
LIIAALTQVLWCRRTWLETTGNTFCQVGWIRVSKAETFDARSFYLIHDMLETVHKDKIPAPEPRQVALLLPLLAAEKTCQVMLYRNKFLGPNFRPSRM